MIAARAAQPPKTKRQISMRHTNLLHIIDGKNQYILLNVHLPMPWAPESEFADAIKEIQRNATNIAAETKCNYFITGGDWNVELWNRGVPAERALTVRAQKIWELLETLDIQPPQAAPQKWDKRWTHEKKNGDKKHIDGWHIASMWKDLGAIDEWHARSDHRPTLAEIPQRRAASSYFSTRRRRP